MWFLAFLAFSFLFAILGNMISPIAAKAQGIVSIRTVLLSAIDFFFAIDIGER